MSLAAKLTLTLNANQTKSRDLRLANGTTDPTRFTLTKSVTGEKIVKLDGTVPAEGYPVGPPPNTSTGGTYSLRSIDMRQFNFTELKLLAIENTGTAGTLLASHIGATSHQAAYDGDYGWILNDPVKVPIAPGGLHLRYLQDLPAFNATFLEVECYFKGSEFDSSSGNTAKFSTASDWNRIPEVGERFLVPCGGKNEGLYYREVGEDDVPLCYLVREMDSYADIMNGAFVREASDKYGYYAGAYGESQTNRDTVRNPAKFWKMKNLRDFPSATGRFFDEVPDPMRIYLWGKSQESVSYRITLIGS